MNKILYTDMLLHEFRSALDKMPVSWVPVGLLEWHGEHLPLGTDVLRAQATCEAVANELGGVVLPPLYGSCRGFGSYEGTIIFRHETAVQVALELTQQLEKVGFKAAVFLSAHGGQYQDAFLQEVMDKYNGPMALLAIPLGKATKSGDHAGVFETSDMHYIAPDLVDLSHFDFPNQPINRYAVPPETLCKNETNPWRWKEDWRSKVDDNIARDHIAKTISFCHAWLGEAGVL